MQGVERTDPVFLGQKRVLSGLGAALHIDLPPSLSHPPYSGKTGFWHIARIPPRFIEE